VKESLAPQKDAPDPLIERMDRLERAVTEQAARLQAIERYLAAASGEASRPAQKQETKTVPPAALPPVVNVSRPRADLEARIGGSWLSRIGIVAIAIAAAFFLKYAFENEWIGARTRVVAGVCFGLAFLFAGERFRKRGYANYGQSFSGGGIIILYLSIYAAFAFYDLINQFPALLLMTAVTLAAVLVAVRANSLPIAALGFIGGYLTPPMLSTGTDNQAALFIYAFILNAGALTLSWVKGWRVLAHVAFAATILLIGGWCYGWFEPEKLWLTLVLTTIHFLLFAAYSILQATRKAAALAAWTDAGLAISVAVIYFAASYTWLSLSGFGQASQTSLAASLFIFYALLFYTIRARSTAESKLSAAFFSLAVLFFTLSLAIRFEGYLLTIAWTCEAMILMWLATSFSAIEARRASAIVFSLAVLHWAGIVAMREIDINNFVPLLNGRAFSCAILILALLLAVRLNHPKNVESKTEKRLNDVFVIAANVLAVMLLSLDANAYFALGEQIRNSSQSLAGQLALSIIWTIYGGALLFAGMWRGNRLLRLLALGLLGLTIFKVFVFDLAALNRFYRIISFVVLGAILLAVSFIYQQRHAKQN
jgi:uncharacterized membrane protein